MPDEALTIVRQIVAEMRGVQATEGIRGVTRFMAAAVNNPRVEFDGMLKLAGPRAILFGDSRGSRAHRPACWATTHTKA